MRLKLAWLILLCLSPCIEPNGGDSLPPLKDKNPPRSIDELWAGYNPQTEALETETVREWTEDGLVLNYILYRIGTFQGKPARMAAFYAFPAGMTQKIPGLLHMHGGGQRASLRTVKEYARRGYAVFSINWGGKVMESAQPGDPNTDWGAVDPTQNNVRGYSSLLPQKITIDQIESPRNNNWFLLTLAARRGITFLEQQSEVDPARIGVYGHSMGGRLTGLVAGSDKRVKAASPSVGGSGYLQYNLWGLAGSARRVNGDLDLFRKTIAGESYLSRIQCPYLFLSATNDFNAPMEFVEQGMKLVPHDDKRTVYAVHLNHRFTLDAQVSRKLWFDAHLKQRLTIPETPQAELILDRNTGIPVYQVKPDTLREIAKVDIYYGYERDPRNRFWADAEATRQGDVWVGECPVFDLDEPLFVLANVSYKLSEEERVEGDPETFLLSVADRAYPRALQEAGIKATEKHQRTIDDFSRGFHDWYILNQNNPHHWQFATRKLADPRWSGPLGGHLDFEVTTTEDNNVLGVVLETDSWRGYVKRRPRNYTALVRLPKKGTHPVSLSARDFTTQDGQPLADWEGITLLHLRAADKIFPQDQSLKRWQGKIPTFAHLRWEGGKIIPRPKPYPAGDPNSDNPGGLADPEFLKAIEDSLKRE